MMTSVFTPARSSGNSRQSPTVSRLSVRLARVGYERISALATLQISSPRPLNPDAPGPGVEWLNKEQLRGQPLVRILCAVKNGVNVSFELFNFSV
jgi:hypothetical protein